MATYLALRSDPGKPVHLAEFLEDLARVVQSRPWHEKLDRVAELAHRKVGTEHAAHALGNDVSALGSVPLALLAFLVNQDSPAAAIRYAVRAGGDTDTIAAMAGALAGARAGALELPAEWVDRLEPAARMSALAEQLARIRTASDHSRRADRDRDLALRR